MGEQTFLAKLMGGFYCACGINDQIKPSTSFTNALLINLKTVDMKIFLQAKIFLRNVKGYTIEDKALTSQ